MHESADADTDQDIDKHAADNSPGIAQDGWEPIDETGMILFPFLRLCGRMGLYLLYPIAQIRREAHAAKDEAACHAQQDATGDVDERHLQAE